MSKKKTTKMPANPSATEDVIRCLSKLDPNYLLSRAEVARFLRISLQTLYRRCKKGLIQFVKAERNVRFTAQAVLTYIEVHQGG